MRSSFRSLIAATLAAGLLALPLAAGALDLIGEDTDLFLTNPSIPAEIPNALIILDNTSNWSQQAQHWPPMTDATCLAAGITGNQQGDSEVCAIYKQVSLLTQSVNVGLMMFNDNATGGTGGGAYVRFAVRSMNDANRTSFQTTLSRISTNNAGDKTSSNVAYEYPMNDAFRYINSFATFAGAGAAASAADTAGYTSTAKTAFSFDNTSSTSCGYDYIIFIGNGFPDADKTYASELIAAADLLNDSANVTPNTSAINTTGSNADVWSRFLYNYGVKVAPGSYRHVTTYTIDVCKDLCSATQATLLQSMASVSYGRYFRATSLDEISNALKDIFSQVQAVNSVFAATSLPVSINVRGTNLNQVYIGVFRPDTQLSPRWWGNLKQYKLGVDSTGSLQLVDANNTPAVNLNTGFVANTAKSFWTGSSTFWSYRSPFRTNDAGGASDGPDGDLVEKGGVAQRIRFLYPYPDSTTAQTRNVYTCTGTCLTAAGGTLLNDPTDATYATSHPETQFKATNDNITADSLKTFRTVNISSLTASGTTATATAASPHGFSDGDLVTISGAVPELFNTAATGSAVTLQSGSDTVFTYSLASTPDTTHAYVTLNTLSSSGLTATTDLISVSGASPADYNVTDQSVAAVVGNLNQVSYALTTAPTSAASGYSATAKRRITSLSWDSGTARATVGLAANHNYVSGDSITISGVMDGSSLDTVLNGTFSITKTNATSFTYSPGSTPSGGSVTTGVATTSTAVPTTWSSGNTVKVSGSGNSAYDTTGSIVATGTNTFSYNTNGTPSGSVSGTFAAEKIVSSDTNVWTVYGAVVAVTGSGNSKVFTVTLTLNQNCKPANPSSASDCGTTTSPSEPVAGQNPQTLATTTNPATFTNASITVSGVRCTTRQGNSNVAVSGCSGSGMAITNVTNAGLGTFTIEYRPSSLQGGNAPSSPTVSTSSANVSATGPTGSPSMTVTGIVPGNVTVARTGTTMYAAKDGDLTSYVTSITNQSVATGTITAYRSSVTDPYERTNLIAWVRGQDNKDNENLKNALTDQARQLWDDTAGVLNTADVRASVHGDVLHSRPAVVNYNRNGTSTQPDDNDVYLFYGANDGMFHAVRGGQFNPTDLDPGGDEQWAFIPQEFFGKLKRLRDQTPFISSTHPRDYFFDGPIGTYSLDAATTQNPLGNGKLGDTGDKVNLFIGMRRGGRYIYALDVSNPVKPKFLWKKGCPDVVDTDHPCDARYGELGQTWSEPKLGYLQAFKNDDGTDKLVLLFGAGYDPAVEDFQPCAITSFDSTTDTPFVTAKTGVVFPNTMTTGTCPPSGGTTKTAYRTMGRGIYIVDAANGDVLWRAVSSKSAESSAELHKVDGMDYAIAADLAVLKNRDNTGVRATARGGESVPTGYLDRIYAVDTGGNIWRVDVSNANTANWVVTKFASIGAASGTTPTNMRKFLSSPDVVYSSDTNGIKYDAVLLGSGDREHPFDEIVANRFYMFKDRNIGSITKDMATDPLQLLPATLTSRPTLGEADLVDVTSDCLQSVSLCSGGATQQATLTSDITTKSGWLLQLTNSGEKTIAPATTSAGTVIFNTNQPKQDTVSGTAQNTGEFAGNFCTSALGTARQYGVNFQNATSNNIFAALPAQFQSSTGRFAVFAGGGFLPTPVPVVVQINGRYYQTVISGVQATNPGGLTLQTRLRTYWYNKTR